MEALARIDAGALTPAARAGPQELAAVYPARGSSTSRGQIKVGAGIDREKGTPYGSALMPQSMYCHRGADPSGRSATGGLRVRTRVLFRPGSAPRQIPPPAAAI